MQSFRISLPTAPSTALVIRQKERCQCLRKCSGNPDPVPLSTAKVDALPAHQSVHAEREQLQVLFQKAHFHNFVELGLVVGTAESSLSLVLRGDPAALPQFDRTYDRH